MRRRWELTWGGMAAYCLVMVLLSMIFVVNTDIVKNPDLRFLYNRAYQMVSCLKDGKLPVFYYNDFGGVGYGSSFFYGSLTLYPFLVFVPFGIKAFLMVYITVTVVLTYFGVCKLVKRFTLNYRFIGCMYLCSCFALQTLYAGCTYAGYLGVALSYFFLAYCVDFFRDRKSCRKAALFFLLILGTHLVTAVLSFVCCCMFMVLYFDKKRFIDYIKFASLTGLLCLGYLVNILYHSDILTSVERINRLMLDYAESGYKATLLNYQSCIPVLGSAGFLVGSLLGLGVGVDGFRLLNIGVFIVALILLVCRKGKSWREWLVLGLVAGLGVVSCRPIWIFLNRVWLNPIQFPLRYMGYAVLAFLVIAFRGEICRKKIIFLLCLPDLLLLPFMSDVTLTEEYSDLFCQIENGEYLDKSFSWDIDEFTYMSSHVTDQYGNEYPYRLEKDRLIADVTGENLVLTFPKLYYRGYWCSNGEVKMGRSQFIEVDVGSVSGEVMLQYKHPIWVMLVQVFSVLLGGSVAVLDYRK